MRESSLEVARGDFVVLPCSFYTSASNHLSRLNMIWTLTPFSSPEAPIQVWQYICQGDALQLHILAWL